MEFPLNPLKGSSDLKKPASGQSIVEVPRKVQQHFVDDSGQKCLVVVLDGFGRRVFEHCLASLESLRTAVASANVSWLSGYFPTKTAPMIHSLYTGLTPLESGVISWGSLRMDNHFGGKAYGFGEASLFESLHVKGVRVTLLRPSRIPVRELRRKLLFPRVELESYKSIAEAADIVRAAFARPERRCVWLYSDYPDVLGHRHGPSSPETLKAVESFLEGLLQEIILPCLDAGIPIALSADHGQVDLVEAVDLSQLTNLSVSVSSSDLLFQGNRFMLFQVAEPDSIASELTQRLPGKVLGLSLKQCLEESLYGPVRPDMGPEYFGRLAQQVGNLAVLAQGGCHLSWGQEFSATTDKGGHGSLTSDELVIPWVRWGLQ